MKALFRNIKTFLLVLLGLIMISWIIWSRFIRERIIRDIPDPFLTEYRVWILSYICVVYLIVIISLIKQTKNNTLSVTVSEIIFKPLKTFDHFLKYNILGNDHYTNFSSKIISYFIKHLPEEIIKHMLLFQVIPRVILCFFLLLDTFIFCKLELFYKVVLIGLIPLVSKYVFYSVKEIYDHWINTLETQYAFIYVYEKGYECLISRQKETEAKYHLTKASIKEYIEIKYENILYNLFEENFPYEYVGHPFPSDSYCEEHFRKNNTIAMSDKDKKEMKKAFNELMPKVLELKTFISNMNSSSDDPKIKYTKIAIFIVYFVCWSYILIVSYKECPIYLYGAKYLLFDFMSYLCDKNNPFIETQSGSTSRNLLTYENIKIFFTMIKNKLFKT